MKIIQSKTLRKSALSAAILGCISVSQFGFAADWDGIPVPADAGSGKVWELHPLSDDFNYDAPAIGKSKTFDSRWSEGFINPWLGPGLTEYYAPNSSVENGELIIKASRKPNSNKIHAGAVHSNESVQYPIYMEARASFTNLTMANAFWFLNTSSSQEIDVIEAYGSDRPDEKWFDTRMHLSHHVFAFNPWRDYQPKDSGSWVQLASGESWRNDYHTVGVYWRDPWHLEYYIDGKLARVTTGEAMIDPNGYTGGRGLSDPMQAIFDAEHQPWRDAGTAPPTDAELADPNRNKFKIDWVRLYKPVDGTSEPVPTPTPTVPTPTPTPTTSVDGQVDFDAFTKTGKEGSAVAGDIYNGFNPSSNGNINYNTVGDWAEYDLPLSADGEYRVELDVASPLNGDIGADISIDGIFVGNINVKNTGGWGAYQTFSLADTINIGAGTHKVRVQSAGGSVWQWNGDAIRFVRVGDMTKPVPSAMTIEAEDYSNTGGAYQGFQTYTVNGEDGINYNQKGDWVEYTINVAAEGDYQFTAYTASPQNGASLALSVNGQSVLSQAVANTGGWDNFQAVQASNTVSLPKGEVTIRITSNGNTTNTWEWNADRFVFEPAN